MSIFLSEPLYVASQRDEDVEERLTTLETEMTTAYKNTASIPATAIGDYIISNTEFHFLNGVTSNIQSQLNTLSSTISATPGANNAAISNAEYITLNGSDVSTTIQAQINKLSDSIAALSIRVTGTSLPVGTIVAFAGELTAETPPEGYLLCNGASVSQSTYASLYNKIGTLYDNNRNAIVGKFWLPDLRQNYIKGAGNNGTYEIAPLPTNVGQFQGMSVQSHRHQFVDEGTGSKTVDDSNLSASSTVGDNETTVSKTLSSIYGVSGDTLLADETRGNCLSMYFVIKF